MKLFAWTVLFLNLCLKAAAKAKKGCRKDTFVILNSLIVTSGSSPTFTLAAPLFKRDDLTTAVGLATSYKINLALPSNATGCIGQTTFQFNDGSVVTMSRTCQPPEDRPILGSTGKYPCGTGLVKYSENREINQTIFKLHPDCKCK